MTEYNNHYNNNRIEYTIPPLYFDNEDTNTFIERQTAIDRINTITTADFVDDFICKMKLYLPENVIPKRKEYDRFVSRCNNKNIFNSKESAFISSDECMFWIESSISSTTKTKITTTTTTVTRTTVKTTTSSPPPQQQQRDSVLFLIEGEDDESYVDQQKELLPGSTRKRMKDIPLSSFFWYDMEEDDDADDFDDDDNESYYDESSSVGYSSDILSACSSPIKTPIDDVPPPPSSPPNSTKETEKQKNSILFSEAEHKRRRGSKAERFYIRNKEYSVKRLSFTWYNLINLDRRTVLVNSCSNSRCINPRHITIKNNITTDNFQKQQHRIDTPPIISNIPGISKNKRRRKFIREKTDILIDMIKKSDTSDQTKKELADFCKKNYIHKSTLCRLRKRSISTPQPTTIEKTAAEAIT